MKKSTKPTKRPLKRLTLSISFVLASTMLYVPAYADQSNSTTGYQIQAGLLSDALNQVAQQANVSILFNSRQVGTYPATAFSGNYTADQAFEKLLENTPFQIQKTPAGYLLLDRPLASQSVSTATAAAVMDTAQVDSTGIATTTNEKAAVQLAPMVVYGEKDRDTQGYDDIYDKNYSSVYAGKEQIERYKGASPADLFKGMANVYSGDARNSGAVDPNIRGVQGPGRIALTVDGTEQALTVWRGYNGANNRNYIDPNLIGGLQVIKGPHNVRDVKSGIGGAVVVNTLSVDDVLKPEENYGGEIKLEGSNNTIKERINDSWVGRDYRDIVEENGWTNWPTSVYTNDYTYQMVRGSSENTTFNLEDQAARLALAARNEHFEVLAAYAWRSRGNYFAGKKGASFYTEPTDNIPINNFVPYIANALKPGNEVPNTSSEMESWLLKASYKPTDDQKISIGYRNSDHTYGEIMPSRINWSGVGSEQNIFPQWPLSNINVQATNLDYEYKPKDNRWIDLHASLWMTDADSETYSSGGFPTYRLARDTIFDRNRDRDNDGVRDRDETKDYLIVDTAFTSATNTRKGINISNKMQLKDNLYLTLSGDFQREKLKTHDEYFDDLFSGVRYRMFPRAGQREEQEYKFNFDWKPGFISGLNLSAGARTTSYWLQDDFRDRMVRDGDTRFTAVPLQKAVILNHFIQNPNGLTQAEIDAAIPGYLQAEEYKLTIEGHAQDDITESMKWYEISLREEMQGFALGSDTYQLMYKSIWYANETGHFNLENNPYFNGTIDLKNIENLVYMAEGQPAISGQNILTTVEGKTGKKKNSDKWVPFISASYDFTPESRLYLNYNEALRMPSMFEGTVGFSAALTAFDLKPEHAKAFEVAYVHDLSTLFDTRYADVKLAYFHTTTHDVIERDIRMAFTNVDKQTIAGWELQGRYDNGRFFTDLSLTYNQKNEVCDDHSSATSLNPALYLNPSAVKRCLDYGFSNGYLATMVLPEYSANLSLGSRFFDEKLELGSRLTWHSKHDKVLSTQTTATTGGFFNPPFAWDNLLLVDAYLNYKPYQDISLDFVGTNLTNKYYLDPLSRSYMPAPGRTLKLALTYNF